MWDGVRVRVCKCGGSRHCYITINITFAEQNTIFLNILIPLYVSRKNGLCTFKLCRYSHQVRISGVNWYVNLHGQAYRQPPHSDDHGGGCHCCSNCLAQRKQQSTLLATYSRQSRRLEINSCRRNVSSGHDCRSWARRTTMTAAAGTSNAAAATSDGPLVVAVPSLAGRRQWCRHHYREGRATYSPYAPTNSTPFPFPCRSRVVAKRWGYFHHG